MKDVGLFLLKKVFKSRLNWIILALFVSVLGVTFYFNSRTANSVSLETRLDAHLVANERAINENEAKLSQISDTNSEKYQTAKINLESQKNLLTQKKEILDLLKEGRWKEAYYLQKDIKIIWTQLSYILFQKWHLPCPPLELEWAM